MMGREGSLHLDRRPIGQRIAIHCIRSDQITGAAFRTAIIHLKTIDHRRCRDQCGTKTRHHQSHSDKTTTTERQKRHQAKSEK